jgi:hypothetical protein
MNINKAVLDEIRVDVAALSKLIRSRKDMRKDARKALAPISALHNTYIKNNAVVPHKVQQDFDHLCGQISHLGEEIKINSKRLTMLHVALAFARAKSHRSPRTAEAALLNESAHINFMEVYGWYEFWTNTNNSK